MKKFVDTLPMLCDPSGSRGLHRRANNLGQYLPIAVPDTTTFPDDGDAKWTKARTITSSGWSSSASG